MRGRWAAWTTPILFLACGPGLDLPRLNFYCERDADCGADMRCAPALLRCVDPAVVRCGDGLVAPGEGCDDGNLASGDGCGDACQLEPDARCSGEPSRCVVCGDGRRDPSEACDDGGRAPGDGCDERCAVEPGYTCDGLGCRRCGDGRQQAGEGCDDGGLTPGDGCDEGCAVEPGYTCDPLLGCGRCGNGRLERDEACDDGSPDAAGGCLGCRVVFGFACSGARGEAGQCTARRWRTISAGPRGTCGVTEDGALVCGGGLGITTGRERTGLEPPPDLPPLDSVAVGWAHTCAVVRDTRALLCFGDSGRASTSGEVTPTDCLEPPADLGPVRAVSTGNAFTCVLDDANRARCFGFNENGESTPTSSAAMSQLTTGYFHSCSLGQDRRGHCWGDTSSGRTRPPAVDFIQLSTGHFHSCGVTTGRAAQVLCWGRGDDEPQGRISTPPGSDFVEVVSGHTFNCARRRNGELYCWGSAHELSDAFLRPPAGRFVALTAHGYHACALREDRTATCWGYTPAFVGPEGPPD